MNTNSNKPSRKDWITLIEKLVLAILGFLTGTTINAATILINSL